MLTEPPDPAKATRCWRRGPTTGTHLGQTKACAGGAVSRDLMRIRVMLMIAKTTRVKRAVEFRQPGQRDCKRQSQNCCDADRGGQRVASRFWRSDASGPWLDCLGLPAHKAPEEIMMTCTMIPFIDHAMTAIRLMVIQQHESTLNTRHQRGSGSGKLFRWNCDDGNPDHQRVDKRRQTKCQEQRPRQGARGGSSSPLQR